MSKFFHPRWKWTPKMFGNTNFWKSSKLKKKVLYTIIPQTLKGNEEATIVFRKKLVFSKLKWRYIRLRRRIFRTYMVKKARTLRVKYPRSNKPWEKKRLLKYKHTRFSIFKKNRRLCKKLFFLAKKRKKEKKTLTLYKKRLNSIKKKVLYSNWIKNSKLNNTFSKFSKLLTNNINNLEDNLTVFNKENKYLIELTKNYILSIETNLLKLNNNSKKNDNKNFLQIKKLILKLQKEKNNYIINSIKPLSIYTQIINDLSTIKINNPLLTKINNNKIYKKPRSFFFKLQMLRKADSFKKRIEMALNSRTRRNRRYFLFKKRKRHDAFDVFLATKRTVRNFYGISNKHLNQLRKKIDVRKLKPKNDVLPTTLKGIYRTLQRRNRDKYEHIVSFLERRLDIVIYRFGFAKNIFTSQQLIRHGFVTVNGIPNNFSNYLLADSDIIHIHPKIHKKLNKDNVYFLNFNFPYMYHFVHGDKKKRKQTRWFRKVRRKSFKRLLKYYYAEHDEIYRIYKRMKNSRKIIHPIKVKRMYGKRVQSLVLTTYHRRLKTKRYAKYKFFKRCIKIYKRRKFRKKIILKFLRKGCYEIDYNRFIGIFIRPTSFFKTLYPYKVSLQLLRHDNFRKIL